MLPEKIARSFKKAGFVKAPENDQELVEELCENEFQSLLSDLKCIHSPEKINEADGVSADNEVYTTKAKTFVCGYFDIELYHDAENDSANEDDHDSENVEDSSGIQTYQTP